jgi:hypothetical protein
VRQAPRLFLIVILGMLSQALVAIFQRGLRGVGGPEPRPPDQQDHIDRLGKLRIGGLWPKGCSRARIIRPGGNCVLCFLAAHAGAAASNPWRIGG